MTTKVQKWGNSLAIRIPKEMAHSLNLRQHSRVDIHSTPRELIIKPVKPEAMTLDDFVARITPENRHEYIDWGGPVGKEIW